MSRNLVSILKNDFGVDEATFIEAINDPKNASAKGSILGAISEVLLKKLLIKENFEVHRIKEKPEGGFRNKNNEARGDFYIKKKNEKNNKWIVVESKGLKSNAEEFFLKDSNTRDKCYNYLLGKLSKTKKETYNRGYKDYLKAKEIWEKKNKNKTFPKFTWSKDFPGLETYDLNNLWKDQEDLKNWIKSLPDKLFEPKNFYFGKGAISLLLTHMPSTRIGKITNIKSTGPLKYEFGILVLDLFFRTGKHEFIFASSNDLNHQAKSPEHLPQNYTVDIMPYGLKQEPTINFPWYKTIDECIKKGNPVYRKLDKTQIDERQTDQR